MKKVARFACLAVALGVVAEVAPVDAEPTAELGTRGMVEQALEWYLGVSGRINDAEAQRLFQTAADAGDPLATMFLARSYFKGKVGLARDPALGIELAETVIEVVKEEADGGSLLAKTLLASAYQEGLAVAVDGKLAAELYGSACDGGSRWACGNLGGMYANGFGVAEDDGRAVELYRSACSGGYQEACRSLGNMYRDGAGVAEDGERAVVHYRAACDAGSLLACVNLGYMYQTGQGVEEDDSRAAQLYSSSCDRGASLGCNNLGVRYDRGEGVQQDGVRAAGLYRRACDRGYALGCRNLGWKYHGESVPGSQQRARELWGRACVLGDEVACSLE